MNDANLEQFRHAFREEAREILVELESSLLELNDHRGDPEVVSRVFRALHTIKGSGAMFGFDNLAAFTHNLENAFDEVRKGRLAVTPELVDLTLAALDQIRLMVEEGLSATAADPAVCAGILLRVRTLAGAAVSPSAAAEPAIPAVPAAPAPGTQRSWHIRFAPGPDLLRTGADPLLLLRELRQLGSLTLRASFGSVPPLAEIEPDRCYLSWEMVLTTDAGLDALRDVFIFVEDLCALVIEPDPPENSTPALCPSDLTARALEEKRVLAGGRRDHDKPDNAASLRVPAARLDQLVNLVGELVTVQARLSEIAARSQDQEVLSVSEEVERLTSALRENSMTIRMMPIRSTFEKFRRLVHDLARDLQKDVELTIEGADTELDKTVIDQLSDPLMHLIRNSMDHGIESSEVRAAAGKRSTATIRLSARHSGAHVLIEVADDGGGIDVEAVRCRAIERGLVSADAALTDAEIYSLIFQPGFSTSRQVTDLSGRGVGMDVVRQRVESLRGSTDVSSHRGAGTTVTLRLPLTLAIIDGLLVTVGDAFFVLPLASTLECIEITREEIEQTGNRQLATVRGELVPYLRLRQQFAIASPPPERQQIMFVESEHGRCGLLVDRVLGNCQTVIRNLGKLYRHIQMISGATILGDGTVALILDPHRLVQEAIRARGQPMRRRPGLPEPPQSAVGAGPFASALH